MVASAGLGATFGNAQEAAKPMPAGQTRLPEAVFKGSIKRAKRYLSDEKALGAYKLQIKQMLDGFQAGKDPDALIQEVVLSDKEASAKLAPFVGVAGADGIFHICMLTVLGTLATANL